MNAIMTENRSVFLNELNLIEQYRRQAELMYLKSYVAWLDMREKTILPETKKTA